MSTENQQEWRRIAEQASFEHDSARLLELANKLAELLGDGEDGEEATSPDRLNGPARRQGRIEL